MKNVLLALILITISLTVHAVPITISTDAELVAAHQSLPDSNDIFIKAVEASFTGSDTDIMTALFGALSQAYADASSDLDYFMNKLQYMNDIKDAMRDYIGGLNDLQSSLRDGYLMELGIDAGFESTEDDLLLALYNSDEDSPITVVGDVSSDDTGAVNALMRSYGVPITYTVPVPEPSTLVLMGLGLAGLGYIRKRKAA